MNKLFNFALIVTTLLFTNEILATTQFDYDLGLESYKAGDNVTAVRYFESAYKQGMKSVSLQFNLASGYYKLGRYKDAKEVFMRLNETIEMRDIATYHLGLIAIKEKNGTLARKYFSSIVGTGKDNKLITLSKKQLLALSHKENQWNSSVFINIGYDDNISSVTEDSVLDKADSFYELFVFSDLIVSGRKKDGWSINASLFGLAYNDTDSNNENHINLGFKRAIQLSYWETSAQLSLSKNTYGGNDFQSSSTLSIIGLKPITQQDYFYLRYQAAEIRSEQPLYDYLEGWYHRARFEYRHYSKINMLQLYYDIEINNRGLLVTSTDSYEYSPTRHTLSSLYTHIINKKWWLNGDFSYRFSDFPSSSSIDREDNQMKIAFSVDYRFNKTFKFTTNYQYIDNTSTVDRYNYDKSIIKAGLSKSF